MSTLPPSAERPPLYRNPFVIAFALGVLVLTVLPLLQRRFLRAPPPLLHVSDWGESPQLRGMVWLAAVFPAKCEDKCPGEQQAFFGMERHLEDLKEPYRLVTFVWGEEGSSKQGADLGVPAVSIELKPVELDLSRPLSPSGHRLEVKVPDAEFSVIKDFRKGFGQFAERAAPSMKEWEMLHPIALVDQNGDLRGFWRNDDLGRGNCINAARMLAKYGPNP